MGLRVFWPFKFVIAIAFGFVSWWLTLADNALRRLTNRSERSEYDPVFGGTYKRLLGWAMAPSRQTRARNAQLVDSDPDRYRTVDLGFGGPMLLDTGKTARWSDSMCLHCEHGDEFPECPNEYTTGFTKASGPMMCSDFEELG